MTVKLIASIVPLLAALAPIHDFSFPLGSETFPLLLTPMAVFEEVEATRLDNPIGALERSFRVMTFNIRWNDNETKDPIHCWNARKEMVASMVRIHRADVVGMQETYRSQIDDLQTHLPDYAIDCGAPLTSADGQPAYNPIFYRANRFTKIHSGFFYLSNTPDQPSPSWESTLTRAVSWVQLKDRKTNQTFYFFNTHFDYFSRLARDESAKLLRQKIGEIAGPHPFLVAGDFNMFPSLGGPETLQLLTDQRLAGRPLIDAQSIAYFGHHGPTGTWSGFKEPGQPGIKPDFLFVDKQVQVLTHAILADTFDGQFPSDHLPIIADVTIKK